MRMIKIHTFTTSKENQAVTDGSHVEYVTLEDHRKYAHDLESDNNRLEEELSELEAEYKDLLDKYTELILWVCNKHPNETRHETALRYIKNAESERPKDNQQTLEETE